MSDEKHTYGDGTPEVVYDVVEYAKPCEWEKFNTYTSCDGSVNICPPGMGIIDSFVINFCPMCGRSLEGKR